MPEHYSVVPTDGSRDELFADDSSAWSGAEEIRWGSAPYDTQFRALWTTDGLYVRFEVFDIKPWHTMTRHDDPLWDEEVVEIFLDPSRQGHHYAELEISPAGVICDARMIKPWPDKQTDLGWDIVGLVTRVIPFRSSSKTWTAIAFLPWSSFASLPTFVALPPRVGDRWRFNVFRIKRPGGPANRAHGATLAAWSPTGGPSFHVPAAFRDLIFVDRR
jgi:Carbohydrate family 9 binding domain-like